MSIVRNSSHLELVEADIIEVTRLDFKDITVWLWIVHKGRPHSRCSVILIREAREVVHELLSTVLLVQLKDDFCP